MLLVGRNQHTLYRLKRSSDCKLLGISIGLNVVPPLIDIIPLVHTLCNQDILPIRGYAQSLEWMPFRILEESFLDGVFDRVDDHGASTRVEQVSGQRVETVT